MIRIAPRLQGETRPTDELGRVFYWGKSLNNLRELVEEFHALGATWPYYPEKPKRPDKPTEKELKEYEGALRKYFEYIDNSPEWRVLETRRLLEMYHRNSKLKAILESEGRPAIEAQWRAYYEKYPDLEPDFIKNPRIAGPYGQDPGDWYEPHEIEEALAMGYEWDGKNCCWRLDGQIIEDDYSEDSEP